MVVSHVTIQVRWSHIEKAIAEYTHGDSQIQIKEHQKAPLFYLNQLKCASYTIFRFISTVQCSRCCGHLLEKYVYIQIDLYLLCTFPLLQHSFGTVHEDNIQYYS